MLTWFNHNDSHTLGALAIALLALTLLLIGIALLSRAWHLSRSQHTVDRALTRRSHAQLSPPEPTTTHLSQAIDIAADIGEQWSMGRFGSILLATEDHELLTRAGFQNPTRARALFLFYRVLLSAALVAACLLWLNDLNLTSNHLLNLLILTLLGFALGWMLPKWAVQRRVSQRKTAVTQELPLLIDLLRLLQGVGLSIDQSLHVVTNEFSEVMPVIGAELTLAVDLYARGRSREQSLARLSTHFDNDDLTAICRLIAQVDQHGGAIQEPLQHFSLRLREQRKLDLKEKAGVLTVKMTGVMVLTLMPALLIITGGPGFLAILRGLSRIGGN